MPKTTKRLENKEINPLLKETISNIKTEIEEEEENTEELPCLDIPNTDHQENLVLHHRSILKEKLDSVLYSHIFCAVCFESNKTFKSLDEELTIISDNWTQTILLKHVYTYVFKQTETSASGYICTECTTQLQQAYIFIKYSQLTKQLLDSYVNELQSKTDEIMPHINKIKLNKSNILIILESCEVDRYLEKEAVIEISPKSELNVMGTDIIQPETKIVPIDKNVVKIEPGTNKTDIVKIKKEIIEPQNTKTTKHHCKICNIYFKTLAIFRKHNKRKHKVNLKQCKVCNKKIKINLLERHIKDHEEDGNSGVMICEDCGGIFKNKTKLIKHIKKHMNRRANYKNRPKKCDQCDFSAQAKECLDKHMNEKHLNIKPYSCNICKKEFSGKALIRRHMNTWHLPRNKVPCPTCGKQYFRAHLVLHMNIHKADKKYQCEICDKKFLTSYRKNQHVLRIHSDNVECCPLCSRKYRVIADVRRHIVSWHWKKKGREGEFDPRKVKGLENYCHLFPSTMEKYNNRPKV